jgi:hypothetical protein
MGNVKTKQRRMQRLWWQISSHQQCPRLLKRLMGRYQTLENTKA